MEFIELFQAFVALIMIMMTLLHMCCGSLTSSRSPTLPVKDMIPFTAAADDDEDADIPPPHPSPSFQVKDLASSSSSAAAASDCAHIPPPQPKEKYDVFLSFRGEDTRLTFTSHLHAALQRKKIETYIDYRLERGGEIGPALQEAIEKSTISVIIFSPEYASSTWCLDELMHILKCKEGRCELVIPVFYNITPSDVRKQQGSYKFAFAKLEQRFKDNMDKVNKWRSALHKAASLSGFDNSDKTRPEANFVDEVVEDVWTKLICESSRDLGGLVGIERRIKKIESLLCVTDSQEVFSVGIWGMGGIGKTTLADAVYYRLSCKFEACYFLANVREESDKHGLNHLRDELFRSILDDQSITIKTPSIGSTWVGKRLRRTKVLIVLDDVNRSNQLEHLLGGDVQFGPGSRIIITTRDKSVLKEKVRHDKIYEAEKLNDVEAHCLFQRRAFEKDSSSTDYTEWSKVVVDYAGGMPLALKILGSIFIHCKSKEERQDVLNNFRNSPSNDIRDVLRQSYNELKEKEKEMFLDIACFYKGEDLHVAERMLQIHGFDNVKDGIQVLIDKSLISISKSKFGVDFIEMHDVVQEVGWYTVSEECIKEAGRRSRLYNAKDVCHVLENNTGTDAVETIYLKVYPMGKLSFGRADFKNMPKLKVLKICISTWYGDCKFYLSQGVSSLPKALRYFYWEKYPFRSFPSENFTERLVEVHFPGSKLEQLVWNTNQPLVNLEVINLINCECLTEVPDLSHSHKIEHINLGGCTSLAQIPVYFQSLENLTYLNLSWCPNVESLPEMPDNIKVLKLFGTAIKELPSSVWCMKKLVSLDVKDCKSLEKLPSNSCKLKLTGTFSLSGCSSLSKFWELPRDITELDLSGTSIEELPSSIECHFRLTKIDLSECNKLVRLPTIICKLKYLEKLNLYCCLKFKYFPKILEPMECLKVLNLIGTSIEEIPSSIDRLSGLSEIGLCGCGRLVSVPSSIFKLKSCVKLDLYSCCAFEYFPEILEPNDHMENLDLSYTAVKELPASIEYLSGLIFIDLSGCKELMSLPTSICKLKSLERLSLRGCSRFESFPEILESMEHMKELYLDKTAIKELHSSIENLIGLQVLNLNFCKDLEVVPSSIYNLKCLQSLELDGCLKLKFPPPPSGGLCSLDKVSVRYCNALLIEVSFSVSVREIDLSGSTIESIPTSIKGASQLTRLRLNYCNNLQAIPELPLKVGWLEAHGLDSLRTVSSSMPAPTRDWDHLADNRFVYTRCLQMSENARDNIMEDAHERIIGMALSHKSTEASSITEGSSIIIAYPGEEIPKWFSYQSEGSSITIRDLRPDWFNTDFLGFALSIVLNTDLRSFNVLEGFACKFRFKTSNGENQEFTHHSSALNLDPSFCEEDYDFGLISEHACVWYENHRKLRLVKGIYYGVIEASFSPIYKEDALYYMDKELEEKGIKWKKCGIHLLYAPKC